MNPRLNDLFARRSVRVYRQQDVADDLVRDLLEAAMAAPSAVAKDPWAFVVVRHRDMLAKIAQGLPNGKMLPDAALGIVVCGDVQRAHDRQLSVCCRIVRPIEHLLLAASALGLGGVLAGCTPARGAGPAHSFAAEHSRTGYPPRRDRDRLAGRIARAATRYREDAVHRETW